MAIVAGGQGIEGGLALLNMAWSDSDDASSFELNPIQDESNVEVAAESQVDSSAEVQLTSDSLAVAPTLDMDLGPLEFSDQASVISDVTASTSTTINLNAFASTSLETRNLDSRKAAVQKKGGNAASEQAVEESLKWLAAHQLTDGGWSCHFNHDACRGQCSGPGKSRDPHRVAATGLALLCFLGAGYTHQEGPYQQVVSRGLYFLRDMMEANPSEGAFPREKRFYMYEQGIASLAVSEAYQMTKDKQLQKMATLSTRFVSYAQSDSGGWDYEPQLMPGDLSIACWQMMALKSAIGSEIGVENKVLKKFDRFLDSQQSDNGAKYGYRGPTPKPSTTAMGLLMRMYRGWGRTDPRLLRGVEFLASTGPSRNDAYYNYYATQVLFHFEGPAWEQWNSTLRDYLISTQSKAGHEAGSWQMDDRHGGIGGRLYTTAMCCMTLEVYYRHMPIYEIRPEDDFGF